METFEEISFRDLGEENEFTASSSRDASWQEFEDSVLAEERGKAKMLTSIKRAARSRGTSFQNLAELREIERGASGDFGIPIKENEMNSADNTHKQLFEAILEPYPHPTDYQRVIITETGESADRDTISACKSIQKCMQLRTKYLSAHNIDAAPKISLQRTVTDDYSRRAQPEYDVFSRPLPSMTNEFVTKWRNGVFSVFRPGDETRAPFTALSFEEFFTDFNYVRNFI